MTTRRWEPLYQFAVAFCITTMLGAAHSQKGVSTFNFDPPVHLCCPSHSYYNIDPSDHSFRCIRSGRHLFPAIYDENGNRYESSSVRNVTHLNSCEVYMQSEPNINLMDNGFLKISDANYGDMVTLIPPDDYCLFWTSKTNDTMLALICFPEESYQPLPLSIMDRVALPAIMGISAVFLIATFVIYCCLKGTRDLLTKSFMCSIAMLALSKSTGVLSITINSLLPLGLCKALAKTMYLSFLSASLWLNVISFIIFTSIWFRGRKHLSCSKGRSFTLCCIFAFGSPFILLTFLLLHDMTDILSYTGIPKPGFGLGSCGFSNRGAQFVFFYGPICVILGVNLILFVVSACKLYSQQTKVTLFQFCHYLKLLILMGVPWIFEVLSFFFMDKNIISAATITWYVFDVINAAQGILIFLVFVICQPKIFPRLCGETKDAEDTPTEEVLGQPFIRMERQSS